jgi:hypothetical protein
LSNAAAAAGLGVGASTTLYGAVAMFGVASTGTPIVMLSGAAAKSATLAAIGGGSLAAGGLGVAAGAAVLGGAVVAVALPLFGALDYLNASEDLSLAREAKAQAKADAEKLMTAAETLEQISAVARQYEQLTLSLCGRLESSMRALRIMQSKAVLNSSLEHSVVANAFQTAETLCQVLRQPLLTEEGELFDEALALLRCR